MIKIGILTFHRANNYGALLQTYALKFTLQKLGTEVKIINYLCPKIEKSYKLFAGKKSIKWFIKACIKILILPKIIMTNNKFKIFRNKYLIDSLPITPANINNIENKFDAFITGSDQVFNPKLTNFDSNFLLSFVKDTNKKYSYAASLGLTALSNKEESFFKKYLTSFHLISVREKQAASIISNIINKKVVTHIDPTLLLNKEDWNKIAYKKKNEEKYILVYLMDNNKKIINFAEKISKNKNLKLISIRSHFINRTKIKSICVTPEEWINYFINAEFIVTNSFHGLAFSINFNKTFFVDLLPSSWPVNSRFENLLALTNLKDRLIDNIGTDYDKPIDWDSVNKIIEQEREKSISYLSRICKRY